MEYIKDNIVIARLISVAAGCREKMVTLSKYSKDVVPVVEAARYVLGADTESLRQDILCYMMYICKFRFMEFPESLLSCRDIDILLSSDILEYCSDFVDYVMGTRITSPYKNQSEFLGVLEDLAASNEICVGTVNSLDYSENNARVLSKIRSVQLYCSWCTEIATKLLSDGDFDKFMVDDREESELSQKDFHRMLKYINDARQVNGWDCYISKGGDMLQELKEAAEGVTADMMEPILDTFRPIGSEEIRRVAANTVISRPMKDTWYMRSIVKKAPTLKQTGNRIRDVKTQAINDIVYLIHELRPTLAYFVGDYAKYVSYCSHPHIALAPLIAFIARCLSESEEEEFLYYCYTRGLAALNNVGGRYSEEVDPNEATKLIKKFFKIYDDLDVTGDQDKAWEVVLELSYEIYNGNYKEADECIDYFKKAYYEV